MNTSSAHYSIKATSQATGLTVETLRAWERRYGVVAPQRDAGGRRIYGADDVLRLRRLREATDRGHPISRVAQLDDKGLAELLQDAPRPAADSVSAAFVRRMLEAARRFKPDEYEQILTLAIALLPQEQLVGDVLCPLLHAVGERWHAGEMTIAQERLVTGSIRRNIGLILAAFDRNARRQPIVFATLPGERHEIGLLMSAMICASRGFKVHYLGTDLPQAEVARYALEMGARIVALSIVLTDKLPDVPRLVEELAHALEPGSQIWLGGGAAQSLDAKSLPPNCIVVRDQFDLERRLDVLSP